jgi:hypothetical protein
MNENKWNDYQQKRAVLLFYTFPELKEIYIKYHNLENGISLNQKNTNHLLTKEIYDIGFMKWKTHQ